MIFASGAVPWNGAAIVPMAGIVIGGCMTASSLNGRRCFAALREERDTYEGALALGLTVPVAVRLVIGRHRAEALVPGLDQTRTVGLVTLPGAFVGVLLGGGSPAQAGAAQVLVLVGLLAAQTLVVVVQSLLIERGRLVPEDLRAGDAGAGRRSGPAQPGWPRLRPRSAPGILGRRLRTSRPPSRSPSPSTPRPRGPPVTVTTAPVAPTRPDRRPRRQGPGDHRPVLGRSRP